MDCPKNEAKEIFYNTNLTPIVTKSSLTINITKENCSKISNDQNCIKYDDSIYNKLQSQLDTFNAENQVERLSIPINEKQNNKTATIFSF